MSADSPRDDGDPDFRERSTITAHKYPTKHRLHSESGVTENYEEVILRVLDERDELRAALERLRAIVDDPDRALTTSQLEAVLDDAPL